jgi:anti-sigma B factor antagonist
MDKLAHVHLDTIEDVPVARLDGDIDISNAQDLGDALAAAVPTRALGLVVDLTELDYLDSAGVHLLLELSGRLRTRRQELRAVAPAEAPLRMVLDIAAVDQRVPLHERVADAVRAFRGEPGD